MLFRSEIIHGWSHNYVETVAYAQVVNAIASDHDLNLWMISCESGLQIANALNAAVNVGLGTGLSAFNTGVAKELLGIPDDLIPMWVQFVGYPAEDALTHGQRPRRPLTDNYFRGRYGVPIEVDPAVTERLKGEGLVQDAAKPFDPERTAEIRELAERFGLPL